MIYVDRSSVPVPAVISSARAVRERERIHDLLSGPADLLGQLRITFDPSLWKQLVPELLGLFHGKCAYCESGIAATQPGDIEHYRPKQGALDLDGTRTQLCYAWLAYDWDNLLIACTECNRRRNVAGVRYGKGDLFPVKGKRAPLLATVAECRKIEEPLLLDPCFDLPEEHLSFLADGHCVGLTRRGEATIEALGLDVREALVSARAQAWRRFTISLHSVLLEAAQFGLPVPLGSAQSSVLDGARPHVAVIRAALHHHQRALSARNIAITLQDGRLVVSSGTQDDLFLAAGELSNATLFDPFTGPAEVKAPRPLLSRTEPQRYRGHKALPLRAREPIRKIEIHHFKAIESLVLELPETSERPEDLAGALMLLGENATGKSTVLEAVALTLIGSDAIRRLRLNGLDFVRREEWEADAPASEAAEVKVFFEGNNEPAWLKIDPKNGAFSSSAGHSAIVLAYGPRRYFSSRRGSLRATAPWQRVQTLFDPRAVLADPMPWLSSCPEEQFRAAAAAVKSLLLLPDEGIFRRRTTGRGDNLNIELEVHGNVTPLSRLSEGYKTVVATAVDIIRTLLVYWPTLEAAQGVLLIDELETHLHPRWKMRIARRLREALPGMQLVATTHDPLCLRGFYDGEVQVLRRTRDSQVERIDPLPDVQGLSVQQLLTSEYFGLFSTEDPAAEERMARYATLAAKKELTAGEASELAQLRSVTKNKIQLGADPVSAIVYDATTEYLSQRRSARQSESTALRKRAVAEVVRLWQSLGGEAPAEEFDG